MTRTLALTLAAPLALMGCTSEAPAPQEAEDSQDAFWAALSEHCGKAYPGKLVSEDEVDADLATAAMVMHVRECSEDRIAVPFHIRAAGDEWNRSRTWVFTRTDTGLRLKHDHRHEDGTSDAVTIYGGDTADEGSAAAQDFPVDAESIALFEREGLTASVTNTWRVEVTDDTYAYQLTRPAPEGEERGRLFRAEFDLTSPIDPPPAPWGHEESGSAPE